jgi:hypothetical protein
MKTCKPKKNIWFLDNVAKNHMCGDKNKFMKLDFKTKFLVISIQNYGRISIQNYGR